METPPSDIKQSKRYKLLLSLAALGVVYGDIGTSPLYALKEAFQHGHLTAQPENIMGILSMVFWSLIIVISLKYLVFILRADYNGEGGILALVSLIESDSTNKMTPAFKSALFLLGIFGAAFLYGDGIITPAISILSAVEGLSIITPVFHPYIVPITVGILILLFSIQKHGTGSIGKIFGPVTLVWFLTIGAIGLHNVLNNLEILHALNPAYAIRFFGANFYGAFIVLGSVFLVVTGGEALYSDLGHFGIQPIRRAWFFVVLPCLILNYFGQGSFLLSHPEGITNPFYLMAPGWAMYPLVALATLATTIASQALITGVFSMSMQAVQQGYMPRFLIEHTSEKEYGQIYIKKINYALMIGCILLVLVFKTSSNLASAYGLAVTATMIITTILFYAVAVYRWNWNVYLTFAVCAAFGIVDLAFLASNLLKFIDGGWLPVLFGGIIFIYMTTWKRGRQILLKQLDKKIIPIDDFLAKAANKGSYRVQGVAVYMNRSQLRTPIALIQTYNHFNAIHQHLIFVSVFIKLKPRLDESERYVLNHISHDVFQLNIFYGFLEKPHIPKVFDQIKAEFPVFDPEKASFFIGRENIFASELPGMAIWRENLFSLMTKLEMPATRYFELPRHRVVEIGTQVSI